MLPGVLRNASHLSSVTYIRRLVTVAPAEMIAVTCRRNHFPEWHVNHRVILTGGDDGRNGDESRTDTLLRVQVITCVGYGPHSNNGDQ